MFYTCCVISVIVAIGKWIRGRGPTSRNWWTIYTVPVGFTVMLSIRSVVCLRYSMSNNSAVGWDLSILGTLLCDRLSVCDKEGLWFLKKDDVIPLVFYAPHKMLPLEERCEDLTLANAAYQLGCGDTPWSAITIGHPPWRERSWPSVKYSVNTITLCDNLAQ